MARVTVHLECDGGSDMTFTETSAIAVYGGQQAALLVQEAFLKVCRALGVTSDTTTASTAPAASVPDSTTGSPES